VAGPYIVETPVLVVEVLSPGNRGTDLVDKPAEYAAAGLDHYWAVDPDDPVTFVVFARRDGRLVEVARAAGTETLTVTEPLAVTVRPADLV